MTARISCANAYKSFSNHRHTVCHIEKLSSLFRIDEQL